MEQAHALLNPSGSDRWLNCTPSARFAQKFPNRESSYAEEGTLAHELANLELNYALKLVNQVTYQEEFYLISVHRLFKKEMVEYVRRYVNYVMQRYNMALRIHADARLIVEKKHDLSYFIPGSFGTLDAVMITESTIEVFDLKYGVGVPVSAEYNPQLRIYLLAALAEYDLCGTVINVQGNIIQPRLDSISTHQETPHNLYSWAATELRIKANKAFNGEGYYVPGKHCQFCQGKAKCNALADLNLQVAKQEFATVNELSDDQIANVLLHSSSIISWVNAVKDYATEQARAGKRWPGHKLVIGRSNRKFTDENKVMALLRKNAPHLISEHAAPLTEIEKSFGPTEFSKVFGKLTVKPPGAPTLVPASDKRHEIGSAAGAKNDFKTIKTKTNVRKSKH